jgi:hypothetical protein
MRWSGRVDAVDPEAWRRPAITSPSPQCPGAYRAGARHAGCHALPGRAAGRLPPPRRQECHKSMTFSGGPRSPVAIGARQTLEHLQHPPKAKGWENPRSTSWAALRTTHQRYDPDNESTARQDGHAHGPPVGHIKSLHGLCFADLAINYGHGHRLATPLSRAAVLPQPSTGRAACVLFNLPF